MAQTIPYTTIRDIALDANGDWDISNGDIQLIGDEPAIAQAVTIALMFFKGEWFLDASAGVPYFQNVLVKNPDVTLLQGIFRKAILDVEGVSSLVSLDVTYDRAARNLTVAWSALADTTLLKGTVTL